MEMKLRPMIEEEWKYTCRQSRQLIMQTGNIGLLRVEFGKNGNEFYTAWSDYRIEMKTERFMSEFDQVINALRWDGRFGGILKTKRAMENYCRENPASNFEDNYTLEHGFCLETEGYTYLLRLNPHQVGFDVYCYCYQRHMLGDHMKRARKGIRFVDLNDQKRFMLPDGEKIRIIELNGEKSDYVVRFINDYHFELYDERSEQLFHVYEFAERMADVGSTVIPLRSSLPERCFSVNEETNKLIMIERGEPGYKLVGVCKPGRTVRQTADEANAALGISKRQESAMLIGALFGWEVSGADPRNLDEKGLFIHPKERGRDEER